MGVGRKAIRGCGEEGREEESEVRSVIHQRDESEVDGFEARERERELERKVEGRSRHSRLSSLRRNVRELESFGDLLVVESSFL